MSSPCCPLVVSALVARYACYEMTEPVLKLTVSLLLYICSCVHWMRAAWSHSWSAVSPMNHMLYVVYVLRMAQNTCRLLSLSLSISLSIYLSISVSLSLSDSLHQVLTEFSVIHPIRTDSEGRFLSASVSAHHLPRSKRHAHHAEDTPTDLDYIKHKRQFQMDRSASNQTYHSWRGGRPQTEDMELYFNVTVFSQELHLRLHPNSRLVAPTATMEWEESGQFHSEPIGDTSCFYTGQVTNMEDSAVAISNCDGLVNESAKNKIIFWYFKWTCIKLEIKIKSKFYRSFYYWS